MTNSHLQRLSVHFTLTVLVAAVVFAAYGSIRVPESRFGGRLDDLLPLPPKGWTKIEKSIAESAEMKKAVDELLNFDDAVFYDYNGPDGERLSIYIAYWSPGRMSHRLVASHTPDVCWSAGGWTKISSGDTADILPLLPVGEARIFESKTKLEYVWFWHLVGAESKRYGTGFAPQWYSPLIDIIQKGLRQREEQFFIRISSDRPLEELLGKSILQSFLGKIPWPTK